jgi:hypothetical protein
MRLLFVVFIVSICALLWAAIAAARHIRRHGAIERRGQGGDNPRIASSSESKLSEDFDPDGNDSSMKSASTVALDTPPL